MNTMNYPPITFDEYMVLCQHYGYDTEHHIIRELLVKFWDALMTKDDNKIAQEQVNQSWNFYYLNQNKFN
ncbi:MAG: hypothetical protein WA061_02495 [Microgenomates group bacterium]